MRAALLFGLAPVVLLVACTAAELPEGDVGDELGSSTSHVSKGCTASRDEILANAGGARAKAISRGFAWLDAKVPYSQSKQHEGYRTDCSGFVSMCWELPQSFTTADFAAGTAKNSILGSYEALQPGDGLVRRSGGSGHAVLFLGWDDAAHTEACVLEEASTASDMQFGIRTAASLKSSGFKAMRADGMPDAAPDATGTGGDDADTLPDDGAIDFDPDFDDVPVDDDTTDTTDTRDLTPPQPTAFEGDACSNDDACNPLTSGTGLICDRTSKRCVQGCRVDLHCPDILLCRKGVCTR